MSVDLSPLNRRAYRKLLLAMTLEAQRLELLLAITDDRNLQDQIITAYEAELKAQGMTPLRVRLDPKRPSLRAALQDLTDQTPALQSGEPVVVTVLNAGELLGVRLTDEKSEQEKFFFSLQWTREALQAFAFPIVLWLPDAIATRLAQQAPDFWSWRGGVFEFTPEARPIPEGQPDGQFLRPLPLPTEERPQSTIPIADLEHQIAQLEATAPDSPLLITLYNNLGEFHANQYAYQPALEAYEKALTLAISRADIPGQARSLFNLGDALRKCGRPLQAVDYYQQALAQYQQLGNRQGEGGILNQLGNTYFQLSQYREAIKSHQQSLAIKQEISDRHGEGNALGNLGNAYRLLGQYREAIEFYQQSLALQREIGDRQGEGSTLGNLGNVYDSLGQYREAIEFYQQSLAIAQEIGDRQGEGNALGNLGIAYDALGQYREAIEFHQQSLAIAREIDDRQGEGNALGNLGLAYDALGQYREAIEFHQQSLAIFQEIGDRGGEAGSLCNLGLCLYYLGEYQIAMKHFQQGATIAHEIGQRLFEANSLLNLGNALARVDEKWQARQAYEAARTLFQDMGLEKEVKKCDEALYNLGQKVVVQPKPAPTIGAPKPQQPDWLEKSMPTVESGAPENRAGRLGRVPWVVWFLVGLGLAGLLWWLVR
ncbi:MAG: tetratricopeptide repeat protein [Spirulina sp.]